MKVHTADFLCSAMRSDQYPKDGRPEIAFVGRSNVGKSSLMNCLLGRKGLAKTSGTPGKTQTVNFFDINGTFYFVDLPGYGFAKVPIAVKEQWGRVMAAYLQERAALKLVCQLVDARHKPSPKDLDMLALLDDAKVPTLIVATKFDKLKASERTRNLNLLRQTLELPEEALVVPFSAMTGDGRTELWEIIEEYL
jgi:GTP-binding protein